MDNSTDNELLDLLDEIRKIGSNRAYMFEEAFISSKLNRRITISSRWQGYSYAGSAADTAIGSIYVSLPSGSAPYDTYDVCVGNHHYTCSDADDIVDFIKSHVPQFDDMIIDDMKHSRRLYKSFAYTRQNGTCSHQINVYDNESTSDVYRKVLSGSQGITSSDKMAISRKSNARIARQLVRIARMLVAEENEFNGYELLDKHDCKLWGHTAGKCHIIRKLYNENIDLFDDPEHTYGIVYCLYNDDRMDEAMYEMKKEYNHYKEQSEACTDLVKLNNLNHYAFVYQSSKDIPEIMPGAYWK